jgi:hypothetical protein
MEKTLHLRPVINKSCPSEQVLLLFTTYALQPFKAYCAIWTRRSNFRHQASPRVLPRERTQRRKVELVGEKCPEILPKRRISRYI